MQVTDDLAALRALGPVGLEELTATADLQTRHDRKYLVPRALVAELVADLVTGGPGAGGRPGGARVLEVEGRRCFRYESVYFDTAELASYLGAARRRPRRFKVRTRSYLDQGACYLEAKVRDGRGRNVKHRHPYDLGHRAELTAGGGAFLATVPAVPPATRLGPTLVTTYRRATLALAGTPARVTVDVDLAWEHPSGRVTRAVDVALVETKTAGPPCPVDRMLWRRGHRPVTVSKYCTGLAALTPGLPANKWNRVLRRHFGRLPDRPPAPRPGLDSGR